MIIRNDNLMAAMRRLFSRWVCLVILIMSTAYSFAQDSTPVLTARDYGALPSRQMLTISPNGTMVAFRIVEDDRDLVVVYSLKERKMITGADVSSILPRRLYFVNDDHLILVVSEVKRLWGFQGRNDISTAYSLNTKTGAIRQLLRPGEVIYTGQGGLGDIVGLSPGQKHAYMPAFVASSPSDQNPRYSLMRVELGSSRSPRVHSRGHSDTIAFFVNYKGDVLAEERYSNRNNRHSILVPDGRDMREIYQRETNIPSIGIQGLTADMKSLVVLGTNQQTGRKDYFTMSLADGSLTDMSFGRADADIESVLSDLNQVVYGVSYAGLYPEYQLFDAANDKRVKEVQAQFPGHSVWLMDWSHDWKHMVFYVEGVSSSGDYFLASLGKPVQHIVPARPGIPATSVHPVAVFEFPARDQMKIPTLLTIPRTIPGEPNNAPTIILPHGGPASYDRVSFDWLAQAFAERGYLVVQPQFRGSTGFGAAHWQAGHGEWGRKMQDDLTDAVQFLVKAGLSDAERVCIVGASYGGYAALAGAAFTPDLYRCAVSINGVSDIEAMVKSDRSRFGKNHWILSYLERSISPEGLSRERMDAISPVKFAAQVKVPVLLIHGQHDDVVPIEQSKIMERQLKRAGKAVEFIELRGENHHLMQGATRLIAMEQILAFVDRHLAPASPQPTPTARADQSHP